MRSRGEHVLLSRITSSRLDFRSPCSSLLFPNKPLLQTLSRMTHRIVRHIVTSFFWVRLGIKQNLKTFPGPFFFVPGFSNSDLIPVPDSPPSVGDYTLRVEFLLKTLTFRWKFFFKKVVAKYNGFIAREVFLQREETWRHPFMCVWTEQMLAGSTPSLFPAKPSAALCARSLLRRPSPARHA